MALKLSKTITLSDLRQVAGEYWTIQNYQINKNTGIVGVNLTLWENKATYEAAESPNDFLFSIVLTYTDFQIDYSIVLQAGHSEKEQVYNRIKQDPNFAGAEDV